MDKYVVASEKYSPRHLMKSFYNHAAVSQKTHIMEETCFSPSYSHKL